MLRCIAERGDNHHIRNALDRRHYRRLARMNNRRTATQKGCDDARAPADPNVFRDSPSFSKYFASFAITGIIQLPAGLG